MPKLVAMLVCSLIIGALIMTNSPIFAALAVIGTLFYGLWFGYEAGVRETEKRWSDAVAKADYCRNQELERRRPPGSPPLEDSNGIMRKSL